MFFKRADELERILEICERKDVKISNDIFRRTASEIEKIVELCEKKGIKAEGSMFIRTAEEIEQIIKLYELEGIQKIDKTAFLQKPEEIKNIIKICKNKNIKITGSIFCKSSKKLNSTIEYIEGNYSSKYLTPGILSKNVKYLKEVLPYLESIGLLEYIIESPGILTLTIDEIKERQKFLIDIEERIVVDNKLNTIFGVARSRYEKRKENIKAKRNIGMVK